MEQERRKFLETSRLRVEATREEHFSNAALIMRERATKAGKHKRVLDTTNHSPGEAPKLLLALGVLCSPAANIMDEPSNHLDLLSIIALEQALQDYPGVPV